MGVRLTPRSRVTHDREAREVTAPYRAEQVGSLLRPPQLLSARQVRAEGRLSDEALRDLEDHLIVDSLREQSESGLDVFTDGQFRRSSWLADIAAAVDGFVDANGCASTSAVPVAGHVRTPGVDRVVGAKLVRRRPLLSDEAAYLRTHAPGPFKVTMPSPTSFALASYRWGTSDAVYATPGDLFADFADIVCAEIADLVAQGTTYIQLDAPAYSFFAHEQVRDHWRSHGVDPDDLLHQALDADNRCLASVPGDGVSVGVHLCRGKAERHWLADARGTAIAATLLSSLDADIILVECETDWAGGFQALEAVPPGTTVVLGLIPTTKGGLEPYGRLVRRVHDVARHVPLENLAVSPRCGFAPNSVGNLMSFEEQRRKLELVARLARDIWG
jgi:5-methyltetrahydropteroyltriglutamate--homocysteine methyltransferase